MITSARNHPKICYPLMWRLIVTPQRHVSLYPRGPFERQPSQIQTTNVNNNVVDDVVRPVQSFKGEIRDL